MVENQGKVFIKAKALKTIILFAKRYANENIPEYDWKEVYGFLIGRIVDGDVHVDSAVAMTSGEATEVVFDTSHYSKAWELDNEIAQMNNNSFVCGWWHTHPFKSNPNSIFLSSIDVMNHLGFQGPNPLAIALVHDPSKVKSTEIPYGIKVFRLTRADFTEAELDELALDLNPEGTTKSDPDNIIYVEVPFEIIDVSPQLFFDSLVDVIDRTNKGKPLELAYKEELEKGNIENFTMQNITEEPARLTSIPNTSGHLPPSQGKLSQVPAGEPTTVSPALPEEMEEINRTHVLPFSEFQEKGEIVEEADGYYKKALDAKQEENYELAIKNLEKSARVYSRLKGSTQKILFIKNELMECYFWAKKFIDSTVESDNVVRLAERKGLLYFMGNAKEFQARKFLDADADGDKSCIAFQQAMHDFEHGGFFGKAGACAEMIGRILYNQRVPEYDRVALFFSKALGLYQYGISSPRDYEPEWITNGFLASHGELLERLTREIVSRLNDQATVTKIYGDLSTLEPWS